MMNAHKYLLRWSLVSVVILAVIGLFTVGIYRLRFDTDILSSLPQSDPVLADARHVIMHHPIHDRVVVDVGNPGGDVDILVQGANLVEAEMRTSGLFKEVGFSHIGQLMPELIRYIVDHLPILFNKKELEENVKPLLAPEKVRQTMEDYISSLHLLEGIGQTGLISDDPLALRNIILERLSFLSPVKGARIYKGHLVSSDGKHILIIAEPLSSGMDTQFSRKVTALLDNISENLHGKYGRQNGFILTPVGAYRAALDNELSAKRNVRKAVLFSTIAIAILLFVGFPRPLIGLLSLLPAFAGTMMAIFVYSLFHTSISMLAVGFGGAIISFTVDYGITYLLFLDRPYETRGIETTREVWSLGLLAMLTTAVSFAFLSVSGFPALSQIGQFAALGVVFTFIFVHAFFPLLFPVVTPEKRQPYLPLQRFVNRIASATGMWKVYAALAFAVFMLFFARPEFHVDLNTMNAVSRETLSAEKLVRDTWGDIMSRLYLMLEGSDRQDLQQKSDRLAELLSQEVDAGRLSQAFVPSMLFPGEEMARTNLAAWRSFWRLDRVAGLRKTVGEVSRPLGFSPSAFDHFFRLINKKDWQGTDMPEKFSGLFGISVNRDRSSWVEVVTLTPGPSYNGEEFYRRFTAAGLARVFDPALFGKKFESALLSAFIKMAVIVGIITILTAFFYFFDWQLTLLGMAPTIFALICTLGTLNLTGQPLTIPTLMVSVVVIGMGTDYALYLVRSYQRYFDEYDPSLGLIRLSVFLSFATTFLGFGVLVLADNAMLKSAGLGLALGIGYSFLGAVMITPPILKRMFTPVPLKDEMITLGSKRHRQRAVGRYRHMEAYPRLFARFKLILDPMFPKLAAFVKQPEVIIDVGTGYGVPAIWLLEIFPRAKVFGIEPDRKRVRFASRAIGKRGAVTVGRAPDIPDVPGMADTALLLDMIHLITDEELRLTLQRLHEKLRPGGTLIIRATVPSEKLFPWTRWLESTRVRLHKGTPLFRTKEAIASVISEADFEIMRTEISAPGKEEWWFVARMDIQDIVA
ncbi:MAG TPA: methyltransferase domain-containing protein [Syntrophales bacterium]|nr:methyltransferase domain-containing protein [Syntrophales bacterium]